MCHPRSIAELASHLAAEPNAAFADQIAALFQASRRRWPAVEVERDAFVLHLTSCLPAGEAGRAALTSMHATDLYLACAATLGQADGLEAFEREMIRDVPRFVAHLDDTRDFADELMQQLRMHLWLVPGPDARPRIATYAGLGPLGGWLRVAAVRTALNMKRAAHRRRDAAEHPLPRTTDPELAYFGRLYREQLRDAVQTTLAALPLDQRNVLRLHYLDGLNIDRIGAIYRVHRATIARWLDRTRQRILRETRRLLTARFAIAPRELDGVIGLAHSQLELSLRRVLAEPPAASSA